jgi:hypothetical protein
MSTSYTSLLGLALPVTGELSGTWGDTVNNYLTSYVDAAVAGALTVSGDTTLTKSTGSALGATSSQYAIIIASGHSTNITVTAPAASKLYVVINTSATYTVTIRGAGPTTGVTLGVSDKALVAWNGSDFVRVNASAGGSNTQIQYNNSGNFAGSANLTFDGTKLTVGNILDSGLTASKPVFTDSSKNLVSTGTLGTDQGGTGLTSFTSGGAVYASSGSALTTGTLPISAGGTGLTAAPTNGQIDIGNGSGFTRTTLTQGSGVTITNSAGGITISATGSGGTVTSVTGTSPVASSGGANPAISLAANYGDTQNPYASKTANYVLASPDGSAGVPTFRAIVAADIPTLNQNTTGTAAGLSATLAVSSGGTGVTSSTGSGSVVLSNSPTLVSPALGTPASGNLANCTFPTLNQNTTGTAAGLSATLAVGSGGTGVTSSTGSGSVVLSNSPTLITPALGTPSSGNLGNCTFPTLNQNTTGTAAGLSATLAVSSGGTGLTSTPSNGQIDIGNGSGFTRTTLTAGANVTITNSAGGITIAATTGGGTVIGVGATSPVASSGGTAPTISLNAGYGDTQNPYASKTANYFLAAPNGAAGVPTFRTIVAADIPTLNQNTTGTAAGLSATLAVGSGGTGVTSSTGSGSVVLSNSPTLVSPALGTPASGNLANCTFPTLNQNTTGTAAGLSATLAVGSGGTGVTSSTGSGSVVLSNSPTLVTPALGTPSSGNLANCTFPTLNQNTTGTAAGLSATLAVGSGGTGATTLAANNVLLGNGTSALQVVAPGTNGNVLTSNGSTWISSAPAGGGSMTLISTKTASVSANLSWTGLSGYSKYLLIFQNLVPDIGSAALVLQFGTGSGPTYLTSNYYWNSASLSNSTITASGAVLDPYISLSLAIGSGTAGVSGYCYIESMLSGNLTSVNSNAYYLQNNTFIGSGCHGTDTNTKTAILIKFTSFNINSGSASLYGISS